MKILTFDEQEELIEHLASRPDIWQLHNDVWVRYAEGEIALAFCIRTFREGFYALCLKAGAWSETQSDDYVEWLLEKYTAYGTRSRIISVLEQYKIPATQIEKLSRDLCEVRGHGFVRRYERLAQHTST